MPKHLNISKLTIPDPGSRFKNVPVYCMIDLSYISTSHLQHIQIPVFGTQSREKWYREQSILGKVTRGLATLRGPAQYSTVQYSTVQRVCHSTEARSPCLALPAHSLPWQPFIHRRQKWEHDEFCVDSVLMRGLMTVVLCLVVACI